MTTVMAQIGLATSMDGINWTPYQANPVITFGTGNGWDAGGVYLPFILTVGDKYYIYYTASNAGRSTESIGLAILPSSQYPIPEFPAGVGFPIILSTLGTLVIVPRLRKRNCH
jgi:hypothetical protein